MQPRPTTTYLETLASSIDSEIKCLKEGLERDKSMVSQLRKEASGATNAKDDALSQQENLTLKLDMAVNTAKTLAHRLKLATDTKLTLQVDLNRERQISEHHKRKIDQLDVAQTSST